jgi:hypothetical protein
MYLPTYIPIYLTTSVYLKAYNLYTYLISTYVPTYLYLITYNLSCNNIKTYLL